jgi:ABC-type glycerol-3-phosphate transport system permease component
MAAIACRRYKVILPLAAPGIVSCAIFTLRFHEPFMLPISLQHRNSMDSPVGLRVWSMAMYSCGARSRASRS